MNQLKEDTEQKIIQAAREVFIEKGMDGARMQEIADRAGINKALLHYYFRSKEKMFDAVFQDIAMEIIPRFSQQVKNTQNLQEVIGSFIEFYNNTFRQNPFLPQFFFHEIWQHPDKLAAFMKSQDVDPAEMLKKNQHRIPQSEDTEFLGQHMIANILGMTLFPHIARPLFQRLFFENSDVVYDQFLAERTDFLMKFISGSIDLDAVKFDENPDDDF
ncbi:MAG: TetR/AcrR family transcriptional regulator [Prolixibacteraceae bacterium]